MLDSLPNRTVRAVANENCLQTKASVRRENRGDRSHCSEQFLAKNVLLPQLRKNNRSHILVQIVVNLVHEHME